MHAWLYLQVRSAGLLLHSFLHSGLQGRGAHLSQLPARAGACSEAQVMMLSVNPQQKLYKVAQQYSLYPTAT